MPTNRLDCARFLAAVLVGVFLSAQVARAAHEHWIEIKSPHFTVYSNAGEHDGRRVALEFEEIRAMFAQAFPKLKVDSGGKPTIIYALRDEDSLKLVMPNYGQNKNAIKLAGLYFSAYDKNFAVVRTDLIGSGRNPYHVMYHEYAHELFRLNYRGLPLWLDEGMAEYWGFSDIENKEALVGTADPRHIQLLQRTPLLPLTTLFSIEATSPLYNTQDHSGIFYAESWALVHYLSMAPEVRDQNLLNKYLAALQKTDDPISAANQTFGDLKKFSDKLESYVRNQAFFYNKLKLNSNISEKSFSARTLPAAEGLVHQADYLLHSNHLPEAIAVLHDAQQLDAQASGLHDALGYYHFQKADYENAEKEFALALGANPDDASVFLYRASTLYRRSGYNKNSTPQIIANLEKVLALQPNFAPAQAFLCMAYIATPDQKMKALAAAHHALDLEPGNMAYFLDYGRALLANGKQKEAQMVAERAEKTATWQRDRAMAAAFGKYVSNAGENVAGPGASVGAAASGADSWAVTDNSSASGGSTERGADEVSTVDGKITELVCGHPPAAMFTLTTPTEQYLFQVKDISKLELTDPVGNSAGGVATCASWKDRKAKVSYRLTPDGPAHGEVKSIAFE
jgi:tetratricopeptide (TPR) repeat protein